MDMKKKLLFVFNPCSGKAQIKNQLLDIVDTMVKADYEVTIYPTQCAGDAKEKVEAYAGNYDLVVCSGGDGTLDEVVTGMMQCKAKVPLGYIPAGSTNDFASSLGIPKDMEKAAEAAVTGKPFPCDVGLFNGDYFVYVAAFGLFTEVSYKTSQEWKNVLGHAAYILEGAKCLHDIPSFMMQVEYNNMRIQDEFIYGMIYSFKTAEVKFTASREIPWTLDGEFGGDHEEVCVKNLKQAVDIMVKKPEESKI